MKLFFAITIATLMFHGHSLAQSTPKSLQRSFLNLYDAKDLPQNTAVSVNSAAISDHQSDYKGSPLVSLPIQTDLNLDNSGRWYQLDNGDRIWLLKIELKSAKGTAVFFRDCHLPRGSELRVFSSDGKSVKGPYSPENLADQDLFWTGLLPSGAIFVEYFEPLAVKSRGRINLHRVDYVYGVATGELFGDALDCHVNVNCPEGTDWQQQKRSILRITMVLEEGIGFCTGNLMNNTQEDQTPYVLTGFHCQDGFTPVHALWFFDFHFEFPDCTTGTISPGYLTLAGCQQRAGRRESDLLLLEMTTAIPDSYGAYYLGWDRSGTPPSQSVNIHHPMADVKKITILDQAASVFNSSIQWNNDVVTPATQHFRVDYTNGTFEVGSSGSALIDMDGRAVGQLHGGEGSCTSTFAYFGRLSVSWEGSGTAETRLKDWLDPLDLGSMTLDGLDGGQSNGASVSGSVLKENGQPVPNVFIQLAGSEVAAIANAFTGTDGNFQFDNVPLNSRYAISAAKEDEAVNGLSVLDIIRIRKHIQNVEPLQNAFQILAADVDGSNSITVLDIIQIQKIILNIDSDFSDTSIWRYVPASFPFTDPTDPFLDTIPANFALPTLDADFSNVHFIGIKSGDVDSSNSN